MDSNKFYLTKSKYEALLEEIKYLDGEGNTLMTKLLASSPGSGMGRPNDLPAHVMAGEMMGYAQEIKTIVRRAEIIDDIREIENDPNKITLGSTACVLYHGDEDPVEYTILGQKEVDLKLGRISCFSPIGAALLGKRKGELVSTSTPGSMREVRIKIVDVQRRSLDFQYGPTAWKDKLERELMQQTNL
jgi:transcription elongation factor GreA